MDAMNEETFRINPQCTLINANNPFIAWRVERVRQNRRAMMTFSGFARVSFPRARRTKLRYSLHRDDTGLPIVLKEIKLHLR